MRTKLKSTALFRHTELGLCDVIQHEMAAFHNFQECTMQKSVTRRHAISQMASNV